MKMVYVVLESQYQSSMTGAVKCINAEQDNIAVECEGYLLEELHNDDTFEQFWRELFEIQNHNFSVFFLLPTLPLTFFQNCSKVSSLCNSSSK